MSTEKLTKGQNSNKNHLFSIEDISGKHLSDITLPELGKLNNIIADGYKTGIGIIQKYHDFLLENGHGLEEEIVLLLIVLIITYYLDNNFHTKLDDFIKSLGKNIDDIRKEVYDLKSEYKGTDKYPFIAKSVEGFLFYFYLKKKTYEIDNGDLNNVEKIAKERLNYTIKELIYIKEFLDNEYYFNYFNTLVSYTNYELLFIKDEQIKQEYYTGLKEHIDNMDITLLRKEYSLGKVNFLNIVHFLKEHIGSIDKFKEMIDDIGDIDGLQGFSTFYSGLNLLGFVGDYQVEDNEISLSKVLKTQDDDIDDESKFIDVLSMLNVLQNCPIKTIRETSSCLLKYYIKGDKEGFVSVNADINSKTTEYNTKLFYYLYDTVKNSIGFNNRLIYNKLKNFIIQYLGLEVNTHNIEVVIYTSFTLNKYLDIPFMKDISKYTHSDNTIEAKYKKDEYDYIISISLSNTEDISAENRKRFKFSDVKHFFDLIIEKVSDYNIFIEHIEQKINTIKSKDKETYRHMIRVGKILSLLVKGDVAGYIGKLKKITPVKRGRFYELLGLLHDIGKADTIDTINTHKFTNTRVEPYEIFSIIVKNILPSIEGKINSDNNDVEVDSIYDVIKQDRVFQKKVEQLFMDISVFNLKYAVKEDYYINKLFHLSFELISSIKSIIKQAGLSVHIFKGNYKKGIKKELKEKFSIDVHEEDVDYVFLTILLILKEIGNLQIKELTYPHITHGLMFFQLHSEFSYLSFVLFHHIYPNGNEILSYKGDFGLNKLNTFLDLNNTYIKDGTKNIAGEDKNVLMVLISIADMIDALLGQRSYQQSTEFEKDIFPYLSDDFRQEIETALQQEDFSDKSKQFNKAVSYLENDFKNHPYRQKLKLILLANKNKILKMYDND